MQHILQPGIWPLCQSYFKKHTMKHPLTYQTSNWEGTRYHTFKCSSCVIVTCPTKSENSRYNHNSSWELQCWHALCMDSQPDGMDSIKNCRSKNFKVSQGSCLTTCGAFTADAFTSQTEFSPCPSTKHLKSQKQGKPYRDFSGYFTLTGQEVNEVYLHNTVERLPVSFPKTLMRKTPKKAMTAAPHVTVLTRPPDTAEMRGTKTVMVERIKPARIAVVLPSAFVCNSKIRQEWWLTRTPENAASLEPSWGPVIHSSSLSSVALMCENIPDWYQESQHLSWKGWYSCHHRIEMYSYTILNTSVSTIFLQVCGLAEYWGHCILHRPGRHQIHYLLGILVPEWYQEKEKSRLHRPGWFQMWGYRHTGFNSKDVATSTYLKRSAEKCPKSKLDGRAPTASEWDSSCWNLICRSNSPALLLNAPRAFHRFLQGLKQ